MWVNVQKRRYEFATNSWDILHVFLQVFIGGKRCLLRQNSSQNATTLQVLLLTALYSMISICRRAISARKVLICWLVLSWFTITLFLMLRARLAYFSVFRVSMKSRSEGLTQAIITVRLDRYKGIHKGLSQTHTRQKDKTQTDDR